MPTWQWEELSPSARRRLFALARSFSGGMHGLRRAGDLTSLELLGLDRGREPPRRPVQEGEEGLGVDADPEAEDDEGHERRELARVQVLEMLILVVRDLAPEDALVEPQEVG